MLNFRAVFAWLPVLLLATLPSSALSAEKVDTPTTTSEQSSPKTQAEQKKPAESVPTQGTAPRTTRKSSSRPSDREFDPTEEISEDLSVPFPVDI